jgi:hypothetical protein
VNTDTPESSPKLTRRALLQRAGLGLVGATTLPLAAAAASASSAAPGKAAAKSTKAPATPAELTPLNRFPRMMHEYWLKLLTEQERATDAMRAKLKTKRDAEAFIRDRAEKAKRCFGPLPAKNPLNPRITRTVERDAYTIENVIFDSRPNFPVTGNLYLPKNRSKPLPAVVGVCGHSANGATRPMGKPVEPTSRSRKGWRAWATLSC